MVSAAEMLAERLRVKNRILGILLRDAREDAGRTADECADLLGIPTDGFTDFETGHQSPSLPQLEVLAYYFNLPIEHFFAAEKTLKAQRAEDELKDHVPDLLMLRQRVIGIKIKQLREDAGLSIQAVADRTSLSVERITAVEQGRESVAVNELELVAHAVRANLSDLFDGHGTVGSWLKSQAEFEQFKKLPDEYREFVLKPINRSYLDLAIRLSKLDVDSLRTIAESILEITF